MCFCGKPSFLHLFCSKPSKKSISLWTMRPTERKSSELYTDCRTQPLFQLRGFLPNAMFTVFLMTKPWNAASQAGGQTLLHEDTTTGLTWRSSPKICWTNNYFFTFLKEINVFRQKGGGGSHLAEEGGLELGCGVAGVKKLTEGHLRDRRRRKWKEGRSKVSLSVFLCTVLCYIMYISDELMSCLRFDGFFKSGASRTKPSVHFVYMNTSLNIGIHQTKNF